MTHEEAFIQAICENPDDDAPRLMYADWLEERGDPRGEFIRVQMKIAEKGFYSDGTPCAYQRCQELRQQERILLSKGNDYRWFFRRGALGEECKWIFRRGFVERVELTTADWLAHGPALVLAAPLREVLILDREPFISWTSSRTFGWFQGNIRPSAYHIPESIYKYLQGQKANWTNHEYKSPDDALDDLSRACLKWARERWNEDRLQQGLSALPDIR